MTEKRDDAYVRSNIDRVKPLCAEAIAKMRGALSAAEQIIAREEATPEYMVSVVMRQIALGWANASSSLDVAISALENVRLYKDAE